MAFDTVITVGPLVLLASLVATIYLCFSSRRAPSSRGAPSFARYLGVTLIVGLLAYVAGAMVGAVVACSSPDSGNLCGLYGVFGTGPLLAAIAIFLFGFVRARLNS